MPSAEALAELGDLPPLSAMKAEIGRRSLASFVRLSWSLVEPGTELVWSWHLDVLCETLEAVTRGELRRVIANVPPGTGKSLIVSVFWPAWEWATDPGLRYLTASYNDTNTIRDNRRLRSVVTSPWFTSNYWAATEEHERVALASDQWAKVRFDTTAKGWRIATSVGGTGTGEHPDRIIIDDPIKAADARSAVERRNCNNWFDQTLSTRVARDPAFVVIMQRLHVEDLSGHLLARGGWEHLCFPMRFDPKRADKRDQRTKPGALLVPSMWPEDKVRQEELDLGPYGAAGQLAQDPVPEGGGFFKRAWLPLVDVAPVEARRYRGWDTAGTEGAGDYTAGVRIAEADGLFYVESVVREQSESIEPLIVQTAELDGLACAIREEQEPGSSGKAVIKAHSQLLAGYDYAGVTISGDKLTRARPFRAQCEAGNVRLVRGVWNEPYISELCSFGVGSYDDQVDGSSCAFNALTQDDRPRKVSPVWGRARR